MSERTAPVELTAAEIQTVIMAMAGNHRPESRAPAIRKLAKAAQALENNESPPSRLALAAARALERVEVGDAEEAEAILREVVQLDGTEVKPSVFASFSGMHQLADATTEIEGLRHALIWALTWIGDDIEMPKDGEGEAYENYSGATRVAWPDNPENWG